MNPWLRQHRAAFVDAWRRLLAAPFNSALSLLAISIALTLPAMGFILLDNLVGIASRSSGTQEISLFMETKASKQDVSAIEKRLKMSGIGKWQLVSKEDAYKRLSVTDSWAKMLASLPENPLPDAFIIEPTEQAPAAMEELAEHLRNWPMVAQVQLDALWIRRLNAFLSFGHLLVALLGAVFAAGLVAVMFNTIRLQIVSHAAEIEVARLIGATSSYIHRPFYYYGALQGAFGGFLALAMVMGGILMLSRPVAELASLYNGRFPLAGPTLQHASLMVFGGALLGWLGARLSVSLSLRNLP